MKLTAAILVLTIISGGLSAQSSSFSVKHLTVANGLPSGIVNDAAWDSNGYLWISILKGISRFDGVWLRSFTSATDPGKVGEYASPLSADDDGRLIFCDGQNRIFSFRDEKPYLADTAFKVGVEGGNHFALPLPRQFWDPVLKHYSDTFALHNPPVAVDADHFVIALRNTLLRFDRSTKQYSAIRTFAGEITLFRIGNVIYLYEAGKAIYEVEFTGAEKTLALRSVQVPFSLENVRIYWRNGMSAGIVVRQRQACLTRMDHGVFSTQLICDELPNDIFIESIKYDPRTQTTAISSDGDGVYLYQKKLLKSYVLRTPGILSHVNSFYSQFESRPGEMWLDQGEHLQMDNERFLPAIAHRYFESVFKLGDSLAFFNVKGDRNDTIWSYTCKTGTFRQRFVTPLTDCGSFAVTENRLFFASDQGLTEMTGGTDSVFLSFAILGTNTADVARDMMQLRPGYLIICGEIGVFGLDIHSKRIDTLLPGFMNHPFRQICVFKNNIILPQYGVGIWVLQDRSARLLPLDKNQYLRFASNIILDSNSSAWIGTNAGILRTNADSLIAEFLAPKRDTSYTMKIEFYGKASGLELSELNGGRQGSVVRTGNGMLSYTGINGIVTVDIAGEKPASPVTQIVLDKFLADDTAVPIDSLREAPRFAAQTQSLQLYFSVPIWADPGNMVTEYRLSGLNDRWQEFDYTKENYVTLFNLPSGQYNLELRISPIVDRSHPTELSIPFEISTPWYKTTIFYIGALLLITLLIIALFRWRLHYLRQRNLSLQQQIAIHVEAIHQQNIELEAQIEDMAAYQVSLEKDYALKNRLISIIGHDIITPLRFMNRAGKTLLNKKDGIKDSTFQETLTTILATGQGLQDMAVNMLNWVKHHHETMEFFLADFDLSEKIDELMRGIKPMADLKGLTVENKIAPGTRVQQYPDPIKTIVLQLLTNSIKYSDSGTIVTGAAVEAGEVRLTVTDQGPGIPPRLVARLNGINDVHDHTDFHENTGHGFGYLIIRDMLDIIGGTVAVESIENRGATVIIRFPATMR